MARNFVWVGNSTGQYGATTSFSHGIGTGAFTWSCWCYPTTVANGRVMYSNGSFSPSIYTNYDQAHWACYFNGVHEFSTNPSTNTWHHFCLSRSGSTWTGYHNGTADGSTFSDSSSIPNAIQYICNDNTGVDYGCDARIAEMAIWKAALSLSEIKALAAGVCPFQIQPTNLLAYWPLWGIQSPEIDLGPNGKIVTLSNTPAAAAHAPVEPFSRKWWTLSSYGGAPPTYTETSAGGARAGGTATLAVTFPLGTQGGARAGSTATLTPLFPVSVKGGARAGSTATLTPLFPMTAQGGARAGSVGSLAITFPLAAKGGGRAGTLAAPLPVYTVSPSGGARAGTQAASAITYVVTSTGGARAGSLADLGLSFSLQATGGGRAGGVAGTALTEMAMGGARAGGQAGLAAVFTVSAAGGARSGGVAGLAPVFTGKATGGARAGSSSKGTLVFPAASAGGARAGGQASFTVHYVLGTSGGARAGSTTSPGIRFVVTPAGGARAGGTTVPYQLFASGGARAGGMADVTASFSVQTQGGARAGGMASTPIPPVSGGARAGGKADVAASFTFEAVGGARAGAVAFGGLLFQRFASGGARAGGDPSPILSFLIFQGLIWTFRPATCAGLWTFRPGTFSGIGRSTQLLIVDGWQASDAGLVWQAGDGGLLWQASDGGLVWKGSAGVIAGTLQKEVEDSRVYKFDWNLFAEFIPSLGQPAQSLTGATVTSSPSGLTIGTPQLVLTQNIVMMRISGGTLGQTYAIKCIVTTSGGDVISQIGNMVVTE